MLMLKYAGDDSHVTTIERDEEVLIKAKENIDKLINLEYNIKHRKKEENPAYCAKYWKEGNKCQKLKLIMEI